MWSLATTPKQRWVFCSLQRGRRHKPAGSMTPFGAFRTCRADTKDIAHPRSCNLLASPNLLQEMPWTDCLSDTCQEWLQAADACTEWASILLLPNPKDRQEPSACSCPMCITGLCVLAIRLRSHATHTALPCAWSQALPHVLRLIALTLLPQAPLLRPMCMSVCSTLTDFLLC